MDKVIIVSQWTSFLDIFGHHLRAKGFTYEALDGRMKLEERTSVMTKFNEKAKPQILLLSIAAGGVGLNLTGANHVYFMEPHWNPQIERQAQDRVHRFGQKKPVFIKR
jgi:transcription termination factor 2